MRTRPKIDTLEQIAANNLLTMQAQAKFKEGLALHYKGDLEQAQKVYEQTLKILPQHFETLHVLGVIAAQMRNHGRAIKLISRAIEINPNNAKAHFNLGLAWFELRQHIEAIASYDKAITIKPDYAVAHYNRGLSLNELKRHQAALDSYSKAIAIDPNYEYLHGTRLFTKMQICDWRDVDAQLSELSQSIQDNHKAANPFAVLALSTSLSLQRKAAQTWIRERHPANFELGNISKRAKGERIRVGYFSADFHNHATAYLMAELFELHDKDRFELVAFSFGPDNTDEMRRRISAAFDRFVDVRNQSDKEVAALSRSMGIDIAVDLKGFTQDARVGIFSYRAAPIQVNYLGYPGTMGADYMDYLIADKTLIPEQSQQHYTEKIVYLPNSYQVNDTKRQISDQVFTRKELGLPESGFVFCCFNNNYKITPDTFDGWMRILQQVSDSVLWLLEDNPTAADNLRREAQQRGVNPDRLVFAKRMPLPEHLARHRAADLFIDTLPCNAHTTASDALWAGLAVLTRPGEAFASRVAASLLSVVGLPELITSTQEEYETLAIELATNPERLAAIRQKLAHNRLTSPLFDAKLFVKHIEDAYTQMHERYLADLPAVHLFVSKIQQLDSNFSR